MVIINYSTNSIPIKIDLQDLTDYTDLKHYLTNSQAKNDLSYQGEFDKDSVYQMPSKSILTITNHE